MLYQHYSLVPQGAWRWAPFKPVEIASKGDQSLLIDEHALDTLLALRSCMGQPLVILSAYRDPIHNARVGGAPLSQHKFGRAFDIRLDYDKDELIAKAKSVGFTGFGSYKTFVHCDVGPKRAWSG